MSGWRKYLGRRVMAFRYSFRGVGDLIRNHPHAQLHAIATLFVLGLAMALPIERWEWCVLLLCVAGVWMAEAINTALEYLTDLVSPGYDPLAGKAKDMASGAVLMMSIVAAIVGILIFWPYCQHYWAS